MSLNFSLSNYNLVYLDLYEDQDVLESKNMILFHWSHHWNDKTHIPCSQAEGKDNKNDIANQTCLLKVG